MHVKKLVLAGPTGVWWGIMYGGCHIVSLTHVFTKATSFKYPTCEVAGPNQFLQSWQQCIPARRDTEFASAAKLPRCYQVKMNDIPSISICNLCLLYRGQKQTD